MKKIFLITLIAAVSSGYVSAAEPIVMDLWPMEPPGEARELPPEADETRDDDTLIAGRRIIKLGNVTTPQIAVYRPEADIDTGAAVVIAPGGGHRILAYDLEGTEIAEWLNSIGITGVVLKYRVPFRDPSKRYEMAVQDGQRAMSLVRLNAEEWGIDPKRVGILGFSAGGELAGRVSVLNNERQYEIVDEADVITSRPDFSILIYAGGFVGRDQEVLLEDIKITSDTPPAFFAHAFNDGVNILNPLLYAAELKKSEVSTEVHIYAEGGHGYGLRHIDGVPVTDWPVACEAWLKAIGIIE